MNSSNALTVADDQQRQIGVAERRQRVKLIVVDADGRVLLDSIDPTDGELRLLLSDDRKRFRGNIEALVKTLIFECVNTNERNSRAGHVDAQRFLRVTRLDGSDRQLFAVTIEASRDGDSLSRAARKYGLTPRETDVLLLILEGASAHETSRALKIAETTVQGYYKRLLSKTHSRNRPAMVANVLDWASRRDQTQL